ncbi:hypothetical protein OQA88_13703 [Cercophora sp. LCS_1]
MDEKQASPELSQAKLPPTQREQVAANPPSRKDNDKPHPKRARLTHANLALFDKMGTCSEDDSGSTKTLSITASGFAIQARKNGVLDPLDSKPPKNLNDVRNQLAEPRASPSPPESIYKDYVHAVREADNEATMVGDTLPLLKTYPREPYKRTLNQAFTAFPSKVGFNNGLPAPQPDFIQGPGMQTFGPFPVDECVSGAVLYKDNPRSVTLPHMAGEWKGPGGDMREATLQSGYDGAALVYARNQALAYQGKSDPPGHASITTFTTDGTQVHFYAHYATPAEDGTLEYHQYPIKSTSLVNSHREHEEGRKGLRNAQDRAREQSYALRDELKAYYKQQQQQQRGGGPPHPVAEQVPTLPAPAIEPLGDYEDEGDCEIVGHRPVHRPTPPTSSEHKSSKTHSTPHSSKAPSSAHSSAHSSTHSSGGKRKASSSQSSHESSGHVSKHRSYWKKDAMSGRYYHKHSDGTVSWLDDDDDEDDGRDSSGGKRKASSSQSSHESSGHASKRRRYWEWDAKSGWYHGHADGTASWFDDDEGTWTMKDGKPVAHAGKRRSYWEWDAEIGWYHGHADGTASWFDDEEGAWTMKDGEPKLLAEEGIETSAPVNALRKCHPPPNDHLDYQQHAKDFISRSPTRTLVDLAGKDVIEAPQRRFENMSNKITDARIKELERLKKLKEDLKKKIQAEQDAMQAILDLMDEDAQALVSSSSKAEHSQSSRTC